MTSLESQWLSERCAPIYSQPCPVCARTGNIFEEALWPGFIGKNYEAHRIHIAAAIHNEKQLAKSPLMRKLAVTAHDWSERRLGEPDYFGQQLLDAQRRAYKGSAAQWAAPADSVWGLITKGVLPALGCSLDDIAFTNWSPCRAATGSDLYQQHIRTIEPLDQRLATFLEPRYQLIICGDAEGPVVQIPAEWDVPMWRIVSQPTWKRPGLPKSHRSNVALVGSETFIEADAREFRKSSLLLKS